MEIIDRLLPVAVLIAAGVLFLLDAPRLITGRRPRTTRLLGPIAKVLMNGPRELNTRFRHHRPQDQPGHSPTTVALPETGRARWWAKTAALFAPGAAVAIATIGWTGALASFLMLAVAVAVVIQTDLAAHRIPDVVIQPSYLLCLLLLAIAAVLGASSGGFMRAVLAGAALGGGLLVLALIAPNRGPGLGDAKLAGLLGMHLGWVGWSTLPVALLAALVSAAAAGLVMLMRGHKTTDHLPVAPHLAIGTAVALLSAAFPMIQERIV